MHGGNAVPLEFEVDAPAGPFPRSQASAKQLRKRPVFDSADDLSVRKPKCGKDLDQI